MKSKSKLVIIYDHNVTEFVTVTVEFCKFLEHIENTDRDIFVDTMLKILPLLYLKALLLPSCENTDYEDLETYVTEDIYEKLRWVIAKIMADKDDYMDVFVADMKYSDKPITRFISEDIADIYQDLKNFVFVFSLGNNETMYEALAMCEENFRFFWGQKLVNTQRALHEVKYGEIE